MVIAVKPCSCNLKLAHLWAEILTYPKTQQAAQQVMVPFWTPQPSSNKFLFFLVIPAEILACFNPERGANTPGTREHPGGKSAAAGGFGGLLRASAVPAAPQRTASDHIPSLQTSPRPNGYFMGVESAAVSPFQMFHLSRICSAFRGSKIKVCRWDHSYVDNDPGHLI